MIDITFITGNAKKVQSAQAALDPFGIKVLQEKIDTPEIQDKDIRRVAEFSARFAANELKKPVIKVDVGFEIEVLNGFPGPFSKFVNEWLSPEKVLKLLDGETNRKAKFIDVVAYCEPSKEPISFIAETYGIISDKSSGENGWGIDKIFVPKDYKVTLASLPDEKRVKVWNTDHWKNLAQYLTKGK